MNFQLLCQFLLDNAFPIHGSYRFQLGILSSNRNDFQLPGCETSRKFSFSFAFFFFSALSVSCVMEMNRSSLE